MSYTYIYYNMSNMTGMGNQTNLVNFAQEANHIIGDVAGVLVLLMIVIVMFMSLYSRGISPSSAFAVSSVLGMLASMILYGMQLVSGFMMVSSIIIAGIAFFMVFIDSSPY